MNALSLCPAVTTSRIDECRDFYVGRLGAEPVFDCGWYLIVRFGADSATLAFMSPRNDRDVPCRPEGLVLNIRVKDVDAEHARLAALGLDVPDPESHPWGDRSFSLRDPNGILLCIYMDIEPDEEYRRYFLK